MGRENKKGKIIAVTGCPTGIAHTFIAEEKFKKVAKELGIDIKVETHGQVGIGNKLTEEEQWAKLKLVKEIADEVWSDR